MSNKKDTQKSKDNKNDVKYYSSVHAESGFLNSLTLVESEHGNDYYALKFKAQRGNSNKPSTAPHSVRVNGVQAKEVIAQIADKVTAQLAANRKLWDANKGKEALTILITLNISDTIAKSYMNKHTGKDVVYIDGRCTSIAYVRIGDEVIFSKEETVKDDAAKETQAAKPATVEATAQVPDDVDTSTGELAQEVILDPTEIMVTLDPKSEDFEARKAKLKSQGYTWNGDEKAWCLS
jgi:hypothetical protein